MKSAYEYCDTEVITKHFETGLIDGVTTSMLIMKSGRRNPDDVYQELKDLGVRDISMEVMGTADDIVIEVCVFIRSLAQYIKVPLTRDGLIACHQLYTNGVNVNVTLNISAAQA